MSAFVNLKGKRYGKLKVLSREGTQKTHALWKCECDCGVICTNTASNLVSGNNAGCQKCKDGGNIVHGLYNHRLFKRWSTLKDKDILSEEWLDIKTFIKDVNDSFQEGFSLRRLDTSIPHSKENSYWTEPRKSTNVLSKRHYFV